MDFREMFNRHLENMYYNSRVYTNLIKMLLKLQPKYMIRRIIND